MLFYCRKKLVVQDYKSIKSISNNEIHIFTKNETYLIKGISLRINYLERDELSILGVIESIVIKHE